MESKMSNYENKGQLPKQQKQAQTPAQQQPQQKIEHEKKVANNVLPLAQNSSEDKNKKVLHNIDVATRLMNETFSISKEHVEACVEACGIVAECVQKINASVYDATNASISENVEHFKEFFNCRTARDLFSLQNQLSQINMKSFLSNQTKIQNILFDFGAKASEPFSDRLSDASDRITKIIK